MTFDALLRAGIAAAALAMFVPPTMAEAGSNNAARLHRPHHFHHAAHRSRLIYRSPALNAAERMPPAPEYGFLTLIPPNAMRMRGYTFVPGKGIVGESCDLPTSACSNQYRDVQ